MAEDFTTTRLVPTNHLLLEQPLLRLPYELSRKVFKTAQKQIEHDKSLILSSLKSAANAALSNTDADPDAAVSSLNGMISRLEILKRKLQELEAEEEGLYAKLGKRFEHVGELYKATSLMDVGYEDWSRVRLDRMVIDYLVRKGYHNTARALAKEKGLEDLTDVDVFEQCERIATGLFNGEGLGDGLAWCQEHKALMKKEKGSNALEFHLRLQQFIELVRQGQLVEARGHMQKYLLGQTESYPEEVFQAMGLIAYDPSTKAEPYQSLYAPERWHELSELFVKTHHELYSLPQYPLLHLTLWAGIAALKTPACRQHQSGIQTQPGSQTVCPICSQELNRLATLVPYAHHSKSFISNDAIVLPNGRVYSREQLRDSSSKLGVQSGFVRDPTTGDVYPESAAKQIYFP